MTKTIQEIKTSLKGRYSGLLKEKEGRSYIPWDQAIAAANELFDPDGYDVEIINTRLEQIPTSEHRFTFGYSAVVRVTVYPSDDRPFFRDGQGFNELTFTRGGEAMIDAALKGSASNGALRALVLLGNAFGLFLYSEKQQSSTATGASPAVQTTERPANESRPALSENQQRALRTNGFTAGLINQVAVLDWKERKALLDDVIGKRMAVEEMVKKYQLTGSDGSDEYPF